ncbi:hypothetical protein B0H14DRAFT_2647203, partial [Mycena olivaceomarginata]
MGRNGLSGKAKVTYGRPGVGRTVKQTIVTHAAFTMKVLQLYLGLSFVQRDEMLELQDQEMPYAYAEDSWLPLGADDDDGWEDMPTALPTGVHTFPPGEEAVLQSHAGGGGNYAPDDGGSPTWVRAPLFPYSSLLNSPSRGDPRTRSFRVQKQVDMWQSQLPLLVDAYLQYKDVGPAEMVEEWPLLCVGFE